MISALSMQRSLRSCKGAALFFFGALQTANGDFEFPEHHLRDVAGSRAQTGHGIQRVEVGDGKEVFIGDVIVGVVTAAFQHYRGDGGDQGFFERHLDIQFVQILQKAVLKVMQQRGQVVSIVIFDSVAHRGQQRIRQCAIAFKLTESVAQGYCRGFDVSLLHNPQGNGTVVTAIGVRHVEHMPKGMAVAGIVDKGDAFRTFVYPAAQFPVPEFYGCARCGIGFLCEDQHLFLKRVFIVPCRRFQEDRPGASCSGQLPGGQSGKVGDLL